MEMTAHANLEHLDFWIFAIWMPAHFVSPLLEMDVSPSHVKFSVWPVKLRTLLPGSCRQEYEENWWISSLDDLNKTKTWNLGTQPRWFNTCCWQLRVCIGWLLQFQVSGLPFEKDSSARVMLDVLYFVGMNHPFQFWVTGSQPNLIFPAVTKGNWSNACNAKTPSGDGKSSWCPAADVVNVHDIARHVAIGCTVKITATIWLLVVFHWRPGCFIQQRVNHGKPLKNHEKERMSQFLGNGLVWKIVYPATLTIRSPNLEIH